MTFTAIEVAESRIVKEAILQGIIAISEATITYNLSKTKTYNWQDPEEWVRASTVAWLVVERAYNPRRMAVEVRVPRRTPSDLADIVVYHDDDCKQPYLVVENKAFGQAPAAQAQAIEQAFGNANSLRAPFALYDEGGVSILYDVLNYPASERQANRLGDKTSVPATYGSAPQFPLIAGGSNDIAVLSTQRLESKIRAAHSAIWAGGKRDPLAAFDEWSKLLFAKVADERTTPTGQPRRFQVGTKEDPAETAKRLRTLFSEAKQSDPTIFATDAQLTLSDDKIVEVVGILQAVAFTRTDVDSIGAAFEQFFGSVFRGGLGQYFTMRQLARFAVAFLDIDHRDFVLDPTVGSGGFLLEALLQVWHGIDLQFKGQQAHEIQRLKIDFALTHVYGIEIHEILARICKINLLLHHDGHTNIETNRSCLDTTFNNPRLRRAKPAFTKIVGNPPFGTEIKAGDKEQLGDNTLESFEIASGLSSVASDHVIVERCITLLQPGGVFGLILPDGLLNNQGLRSNCPQVRWMLARHGRIVAIISLPDHAFRKSGAQNKTSIVFFRKFSVDEKAAFDKAFSALDPNIAPDERIHSAYLKCGLDFSVFLGEANQVGYSPSGALTERNDLYRADRNGRLDSDQTGTILGEWHGHQKDPHGYRGRQLPDCISLPFLDIWNAHPSRRLDPKYHIFKAEEKRAPRPGWLSVQLGDILHQREDEVKFTDPDEVFKVITISQKGEIRAREAGKGRNYPEWRATYFASSPGTWFAAKAGDVVFSSIDLWKGCIAVVPEAFDGALVTSEFPIFEVVDDRLSSSFLQILLRSRYYQRAFRAITTGHSNRRRTQLGDFLNLEISFPARLEDQERIVADIMEASANLRSINEGLRTALRAFDQTIDGRGDEDLPSIDDDAVE